MIEIVRKEKCTGCKMCAEICPRKAIFFEADEEGFWYPQIDAEKCNHCELCKKQCPSRNENCIEQGKEPKVYAAWSKDYRVREVSTSGGVFWEIAKTFIDSGDVVAGARWGSDWKTAYHMVAHSIDELELLRGSKYIQSDTAGIYSEVKEELEKGKKVLFCGTPCQNAAMKSFLQGKYENIYYFDFICRSINSPKALEAYIAELEDEHHSGIVCLQQKNKDKGWHSLATKVTFENGEVSLKDRNNDVWVRGFLNGDLYTRENCFNCQYRCLPRKTADITVGDFWGIKNESAYNMFRGISVVLINSEKGLELWEQAKSNLIYRQKELEEVLQGQFALLKNPVYSNDKRTFFELLKTKPFSQCVNEIKGLPQDTEKDRYQELEDDIRKYEKAGIINKEQYLYLNFECPYVERKGKGKIIPYQNVILDIKKSAKIVILGDTDFQLGTNLFRGSKAETLIRMGDNAKWIIKNGGHLSFGTLLDIKKNAQFKTGYFSANSGGVFVISKKVTLGEDVMIGRNVVIYDSDFHQILDENGKPCNDPQEVIIEDHVWLSNNINIHKGVHIGQGSIVANQTVVVKDVSDYSMIAGKAVGREIKQGVEWSRNPSKNYRRELAEKKIILYGYGVLGKAFYKEHSTKMAYIVDNFASDDAAVTFAKFQEIFQEENREDFLWVIASPNYYEELADQVRGHYGDMLILSVEDL